MSELSFGNKKLGFGLMRLPLLDENDGASIDIELTKKMVDAFIENGFTYAADFPEDSRNASKSSTVESPFCRR